MGTPIELHPVQEIGQRIESIFRPQTLKAAIDILRNDPNARPLAGGTDILLDLQRGGPGEPISLVDLTAIPGFRSITDDGTAFILGGGVTHGQIVGDEAVRDDALPLAQACLEIGSPQLRNRATIAGNLVTASPANDSISALMALGASVEISYVAGGAVVETRELPVADFIDGFRSTVLESGELISAIRVPKLGRNERGIWVKLGLRRAQAISVVHAAIVLGFDDAGVVESARLAMGSVAPTVVVLSGFEAALLGKTLSEATIDNAARAAATDIAPIDDVRATAEYRLASVIPLVTRALQALRDGTEASAWPPGAPLLRDDRYSDPELTSGRDQITDESTIEVNVNGASRTGSGAAASTLLDWIRENGSPNSAALLSGTKEGCAEGECGACTVLLNGSAVMSCLVAAAQADEGTVTTVEGLAKDNDLHAVQEAFIDEFAVQCGFCIPGFIVAGAKLLDEHPNPSDAQIDLALSGNLCRCTGYYPIRTAIQLAAERSGGQ